MRKETLKKDPKKESSDQRAYELMLAMWEPCGPLMTVMVSLYPRSVHQPTCGRRGTSPDSTAMETASGTISWRGWTGSSSTGTTGQPYVHALSLQDSKTVLLHLQYMYEDTDGRETHMQARVHTHTHTQMCTHTTSPHRCALLCTHFRSLLRPLLTNLRVYPS